VPLSAQYKKVSYNRNNYIKIFKKTQNFGLCCSDTGIIQNTFFIKIFS
jgi:hypothetical protein